MRCTLTAEVPPLHCTLIAFSLGNCLDIYKLPDLEVARTQAITDWEKVLRCYRELSEVSLWW